MLSVMHCFMQAKVLPEFCMHFCCRFVHEGILNCARAIRQDLEHLGLLDQLLLGHSNSCTASANAAAAGIPNSAPISAQEQQQQQQQAQKGFSAHSAAAADGAAMNATAGVEDLAPHDSAMLGSSAGPHVTVSAGGATATRQQLPDCRGWTLIITGHSLGACCGLRVHCC
jgi:hypothetical protein